MANKKSFVSGKSKNYYLIIGTIILGIAFVHFGMQINFIQKETLRSFQAAIETENVAVADEAEITLPVEQALEISPEHLNEKKVEVAPAPEIKAVPVRKKDVILPEPKVVRKKEVRETRAERLRRAERILTGI